MKIRPILLAFGIFATLQTQAQTTLFQDNFESGAGNWTLNGGTGANNWIVNNVYTGLAPIIMNTPTQPGGITNAPTSNYLHITNASACGIGYCNSNYDTGSPSNQTASMSSNINASGYTNVTLSFYYLCAGVSGQDYGTLEYSLNGGSSWTATGTSYHSTPSWTQTTVSLPAWDNVATLRFRFRWQNSAASGADPAFSVDQIVVTGTVQAVNSITTGATAQLDYCQTEDVSVPYTATGTFLAGNVFTAQLSDASGSFASPVNIGSVTATTSGIISASIPPATPAGNGYRIRVVSSSPAVVGTDNGSNLTINELPVAGTTTVTMDSVCPGTAVTVSITGHVGSIDWSESPDGSSWSPSSTLSGTVQTIVPTQTVYYYANVGTNCGVVQGNMVYIFVAPAPDAAFSVSTNQLTANFTDQSTGSPLAYDWDFGDGNQSSTQNPTHTYAALGNYTVLLTVTNSFGCTDTVSQVVVIQTTGVENEGAGGFKAWPTSVQHQLNVSAREQVEVIILTDLTGRTIRNWTGFAGGGQQRLSLEGLAPGHYLLTAQGDGWKQTMRLIKQ